MTFCFRTGSSHKRTTGRRARQRFAGQPIVNKAVNLELVVAYALTFAVAVQRLAASLNPERAAVAY